jgi:glycosyltransferase involved in cell wall biosynthesis
MPATLVTLCIPTHNDAGVLGDALRSALSQDYPSLEILVLDNCSQDDTPAVVERLAAGDSRVRCVRHPQDLGMAGNFSAGVAMAKGDLVQVLCADDVLEPGCVSAMAGAMQRNPDAVLAACARTQADESLRPLRVLRARDRESVVPGPELVRECFVHGNRIGEPSAVMFRRAAAGGGFSTEYNQLVDLEMWFRLLLVGSGVLLPTPLCRIRLHDAQATQANIRSGRLVEDKRRLFRQFAPFLAPGLGLASKWMWDARMASSLARMRAAGGVPPEAASVTEVFSTRLFARLLVPLATLYWKKSPPPAPARPMQ